MVLFLVFKVLGLLGSVCVIAVKSQELPGNESNLFAPPSPPPPSLVSPPPPYSSPPPPYTTPPSPPPPPPPPSSPPPPSPPLSPPLSPPPPPIMRFRLPPPRVPPPPKSRNTWKTKPNRRPPYPKFNVRDRRKNSRLRMKRAKEIGCWFVGVAGVMQVAAVLFLVYKKREFSKISDRP